MSPIGTTVENTPLDWYGMFLTLVVVIMLVGPVMTWLHWFSLRGALWGLVTTSCYGTLLWVLLN